MGTGEKNEHFSAFVYAGYVASNFRGFLTINYEDSSKYLKYHWLLKSVQGLVIIPFIVLKLMNEHTYSFSIFSIVGMVSFVLQYIPLFYMLKWASNLNGFCPKPSEVFIYPICSRNLDDSTGGVLTWEEYEKQQKEKSTKITPVNP